MTCRAAPIGTIWHQSSSSCPSRTVFAELLPEITGWRRDFHAHPELLFEVHRTAARVADLCREFGCDQVVTGIGRIGVVAVITGKTNSSGRVVGLRADMDALPITKQAGVEHASKTPDKMHACGHDGPTAMLLGAEDFSYMLIERPGAYIFLGNGDTAMVHHPAYDFNDSIIPFGASWYAAMVETRMPAA